jgi:hypothetical protein
MCSGRLWTHPTATEDEKHEAADVISTHITSGLRSRIGGPVCRGATIRIDYIKRRVVRALLGPGSLPPEPEPGKRRRRRDTSAYELTDFKAPYFREHWSRYVAKYVFCILSSYCGSTGDGCKITSGPIVITFCARSKLCSSIYDGHGEYVVLVHFVFAHAQGKEPPLRYESLSMSFNHGAINM